jgi:outer membrane receptor protein involved in Fe transport
LNVRSRATARFRAISVAVCVAQAVVAILLLRPPLPALAASSITYLTGTVTYDGKPVAGATVTVSGNLQTVHATTNANGTFGFPALQIGSYKIHAATPTGEHADVSLDLGISGANIAVSLVSPQTIGTVTVARNLQLNGSGADVTLNSEQITRSPSSDSFPQLLIQLPGTARGANGVVHMNGDHGVIDYIVDGVPLPQALNREIGSEIDPNDVSFLNAIEGAYPAQYGLRFGSVLNITTRAGTGPAGYNGDAQIGSYTTLDGSFGYHAPIGTAGGFDVAVRANQTTRGLDPPDFDSPHNNASGTNQFLRFTLPSGGGNFTDVTAIHSFRTYQIPNDVEGGEPAFTDDNETQDDTFLTAQFRHPLGQTGSVSFGPALKVSHILDYGDPGNDWIYGEALNVTPPPFGNGGTSTDCANAFSPDVAYLPTTCAYSLYDDRTSIDYLFNADMIQQFGKHEFRAGMGYDLARVYKYYDITLQPGNFLAGGPYYPDAPPAAPVSVIDNAPNIGNTYTSYLQDSWRMSQNYEVDYGIRYDFFTIRSTDFYQGFGAFSPRLKVTRYFGDRASIYAYIGRFFEPFSFENVSPDAAYLLNLPLQPTPAQFDLQPERDTQLEFGGHLPVGPGSLGFRVWQKNANNLIDDTQVGVTALHQDINYTLGRLSAETIDYNQALSRNGRAYVNVNHTDSVNNGCETQLLAPCFGSPDEYTPADHEQRWSVTGGMLLNDRRGGWFSADMEYGSGLSSAICEPASDDCKQTPHTIFNVEKGFSIGKNVALTARIQNLLNDRYYVTLLNAQGNHFAPPRVFTIGVRFGR